METTIQAYGQFRVSNQTHMQVFGLWEEGGEPGENAKTNNNNEKKISFVLENPSVMSQRCLTQAFPMVTRTKKLLW